MKHILSLVGVMVLLGSIVPADVWSQNAPSSNKQDAGILIIEDNDDDILIIEEDGGGSVEDLREELDRLADEIDDMRDTFGTLRKNVNVTGYGETHFNVPIDNDPSRPNQFDAHRFVIGVNARLADWIYLSAEIDYEHAAQELEFEMGYLDFLLDPTVNFRVGTVLIPVGFLNEYHEPTLFWTVERPQFQSRIIPTSWNGTGGGFFGTFGNFLGGMNYRMYVVNSLDSVQAGVGDFSSGGKFRAKDGIRKGRLLPAKAIAEDLAITGRLEFSNLFPGFQLGASFHTGETTHGAIEQGGRTTLLEADIKYRRKWFEMNASVANIHVGNAAEITNAAAGANGNVASNILGYNIQAGIHLPQLLGKSTSHDVVAHFMYEFIDTQNQMPTGFSQATGSAGETDVYTTGVTWFPSTTNVSLKMDYTHQRFLGGTSTDQVNFGMAYMFF
jgi:hypothetical protein